MTQKQKELYLLDNLEIRPTLPSNSHYDVEFLFLYGDKRVQLLRFNGSSSYFSNDGNFAVGSVLPSSDYTIIGYFDFVFKEYTNDKTPLYFGCEYSISLDGSHSLSWAYEQSDYDKIWTLIDNGAYTDYSISMVSFYANRYLVSSPNSYLSTSSLSYLKPFVENKYKQDGYPNSWNSSARPLYSQAKAFIKCLSSLSICCFDRC